MKKILLLVSLLVMVLSTTASAAYFSDISDPDLAMDVESLRLMDVVGGYGDGTYRPNESLTRAQFSKMVVSAMNATDQLGQYATYTVFPDVRPSHWAAAYINLASRGLGVVGGFADGNFNPDATITTGQAVTILMRLLGYSDADVGAVWPDGYLYQGKTVGLLEDLTFTGNESITRGQTAILMVNLLTCDTKDGGSFASGIAASVIENAMLLSSNATAPDGTAGAMQLGTGITYKMANTTSSGILNGRQGIMLLDKNGKVMTFIPDQEGTSVTITVSEATALSIRDSQGTSYAVKADTLVFRNGEQTVWGDVFSWVNAGTSITLHIGVSGHVDHVFVGSATSAEDALVIGSNGSTAGFEGLTGTTQYTIYKNGMTATRGDLKAYDVATYDAATNSIRVSDMRLTGYYDSCYPTVSAPSKITVMGLELNVLPCAVESLSKLKMNQSITILLTEDMQVAGAMEAVSSSIRGNIVGIATSVTTTSASVTLFNGLEVSGSVRYTEQRAAELNGQVVRVSSSSAGAISLSKIMGDTSYDLDLGTEMLGTIALAENVRIYETVAGGALRAISLDEIPGTKVYSDKITYVGKDWRGDVNILVLNDVTGNNYTYGLAKVDTTTETEYDDEGKPMGTSSSHQLSVSNGDTTVGPFKRPNSSYAGSFIGIVASVNGQQVAAVKELTRLKNIPNSAWISETTVSYQGEIYTVAKEVKAYDDDSRGWISLATAHAYAQESDLYVDEFNVVRVVTIH
ncbi:S-layer homology domain-containing protein [Bengtsoniella intestinalis]|uniref:S-layer homology domain-containing protein n=1 Tax=Bengtsoniella intestinalis TaxID=3073143 RepID=UPI00391F8641